MNLVEKVLGNHTETAIIEENFSKDRMNTRRRKRVSKGSLDTTLVYFKQPDNS